MGVSPQGIGLQSGNSATDGALLAEGEKTSLFFLSLLTTQIWEVLLGSGILRVSLIAKGRLMRLASVGTFSQGVCAYPLNLFPTVTITIFVELPKPHNYQVALYGIRCRVGQFQVSAEI